jgi:predicted GNAT family acetyltransferase
MDDGSVDIDVRDNREIGRYEVSGRDATATLDYRPECRLVIAHTHVPLSLDEPGHRVGGQLLRAAIARARAEHLTLVPSCPFARRWLGDNPDAWAGVAIDWSVGVNPQRAAAAPDPASTVVET